MDPVMLVCLLMTLAYFIGIGIGAIVALFLRAVFTKEQP